MSGTTGGSSGTPPPNQRLNSGYHLQQYKYLFFYINSLIFYLVKIMPVFFFTSVHKKWIPVTKHSLRGASNDTLCLLWVNLPVKYFNITYFCLHVMATITNTMTKADAIGTPMANGRISVIKN